MNFNALQQGLSVAPEVIPDPSPGNITSGAGKLPNNTDGIIRLVVTQAVTQEIRTLPDPGNADISLTLVLYSTAGANCQVNFTTKINTSGNTHILFTAADQVVQLYSVPTAPSGTNNPPKYRWEVILNDGTSLS